MNIQKITVVIAFFILLALAFYGWKHQQSFQPVQANQPLIDDLSQKVNDIAVIEIHKQDAIISIEKKDNQWLLRQRDNYPVDISKVRALLLQLAESSLLEEKTSNSELYEQLGLDADSKVTIQAYLDTEKNEPLFSLAIGSTKGTIGTYVIKGNDSQSWLTSGTIRVDDTAHNWLQAEIVNIEPSDIATISIQHPGNQRIVLTANQPEGFLLEGLTQQQESDLTKVNSITTAFRNLQFQQVENASSKELSAGIVSEVMTRDGMRMSARIFGDKDQYWASFEVDASLKDVQVAADNTTDTAEALLAVTQQRVKQLTNKLSSRLFRISQATGKALSLQKSDLITKPKTAQ